MAAALSKLLLSPKANSSLPSLENISLPFSGFLKFLLFELRVIGLEQKKKSRLIKLMWLDDDVLPEPQHRRGRRGVLFHPWFYQQVQSHVVDRHNGCIFHQKHVGPPVKIHPH